MKKCAAKSLGKEVTSVAKAAKSVVKEAKSVDKQVQSVDKKIVHREEKIKAAQEKAGKKAKDSMSFLTQCLLIVVGIGFGLMLIIIFLRYFSPFQVNNEQLVESAQNQGWYPRPRVAPPEPPSGLPQQFPTPQAMTRPSARMIAAEEAEEDKFIQQVSGLKTLQKSTTLSAPAARDLPAGGMFDALLEPGKSLELLDALPRIFEDNPPPPHKDIYGPNYSTQVFSRAAIASLLTSMESHWPAARNIERIVIAPDTRLIIVGDIHGQLEDMLWIFMKYGKPSRTNRYLFNGDIVDRSSHSLEVVLLLSALRRDQPVTFLEGILGVLSEEATPQVRKDTYLFMVLGALPWCGKQISKNNPQQISRILDTVEAYITARDKTHNDVLRVWRSADPLPQYDMIDALWRQVKNMAEESWDDQGYIPRPYVAFEGLLEEAQRQSLPQFTVPAHTEDVNYPRPHVIFRLFTVSDCNTEQGVLPKSDSIVRFIVEENLFQILLTYYKERKECAKKLLSYYNREKVPICHQIVEIMFASMFRLPDSPMIDIAYATIFIELCKLQPQNMPQALALATELLFDRIDTMSKTATDRFVNWFGHHLSNFQFRWQWDEWADCITQDENSPKPSFIREVLEKCRRFCYHQRIVETVPQDFEHLVPNEPSIRFKYRQDEDEDDQDDINPAVSCSRKLERAIRSRAPQDDIFEILSEVPKPSSAFEDNDDDNADYNPNALDVFVQTLMFIASKTFSHSFSALHKYHMMLKRLARNEGAKVQLLQILFDMWRDHPQMLVVLIDKCIRAQIVDPGSVARWVFSPDMGKYFNRYYIWEILHATITKMNHHVNRVQDEYDTILSRVHNASVKMEEDTEQEMMDTYGAFAPSESEVASYKEKLDNSKAEQKNLFLIIFQRFIAIITEHIDKHGPVPTDALLAKREPTKNETWLINALERLKEVFLKHEKVTVRYQQTLGELLFTDNVEPCVLAVFSSFRALRS